MRACDVLDPELVISHLGHMYVGAQTPHSHFTCYTLRQRALSCSACVGRAVSARKEALSLPAIYNIGAICLRSANEGASQTTQRPVEAITSYKLAVVS